MAHAHMMEPALRETVARAAAKDAGNRAMVAGGRTAWSMDDYRVAAAELARLLPAAGEFSVCGSFRAEVR